MAIGDEILSLNAIKHLFDGPHLSKARDVFAEVKVVFISSLQCGR